MIPVRSLIKTPFLLYTFLIWLPSNYSIFLNISPLVPQTGQTPGAAFSAVNPQTGQT
jgi:hypothetical protein